MAFFYVNGLHRELEISVNENGSVHWSSLCCSMRWQLAVLQDTHELQRDTNELMIKDMVVGNCAYSLHA